MSGRHSATPVARMPGRRCDRLHAGHRGASAGEGAQHEKHTQPSVALGMVWSLMRRITGRDSECCDEEQRRKARARRRKSAG